MKTVGLFRRVVIALTLLLPTIAFAQIPGPNINMVSGTQFGTGDPFLQRQDEPSVNPSTRNPLHLLGGANDYRTVDLPGLPDDMETGDAWLGVFKSFDGGQTWISGLIPGYPQDAGSTAPIKGFPAAADPMVRSGLNGMFYYSGIALTRPTATTPTISAVFVARFNDYNDREASDPIHYLGMSLVADGRPASKFYDKPGLATDIPRAGATLCSVGGQFFLGGNVYVAYTEIGGTGATSTGKLWFSRSTDCGATWSAPIAISGTNTANQGAVIAVDTRSGAVYVVWRRFARGTETDAILAARSIDFGKTFSTPAVIRNLVPFEQATTPASFRTSAYPTAATDANGRVYAAWTERAGPVGTVVGKSDLPDGRIMIANSLDGITWTTPVMVAPTAPISPLSGRGHQFMPALAYQSGKLMLVYYDMREDSTRANYTSITSPPFFSEQRQLLGDLALGNIDAVFNDYIQDAPVISNKLLRRHTLDLRASQASPGPMPVFEQSQRISIYRFGSTQSDLTIRQLDFNPPNLPLFKQGTAPFFGDYIDVAPQFPFFGSLINLPLPAPAFHAVWTDNRDVRPPLDGHWDHYTPVAVFGGTSKYDPSKNAPICTPGQTGMRNQNIYTARISAGLFFGSPGNDKPLGTIQRAFVVTVQNAKIVAQSYRLTIVNQPFGGKATFQQLPLTAPALTTLDITVNAKSSQSRTVFVTSSLKNAPVGVTVTEIPAVGGTPAPGALTSATVLNPDPSSPDIGSPDIGSPDIGSTELYTPDIGSPDIGSPNIQNPAIGTPDIGSPDIGSPDIGSPDIGSPDIGSPDIGSPDIGSPDIGSPDIGSGSVTDTTWPVTNDGNTTAAYVTKLLKTADIDPTLKLQLILHQTYQTPAAQDCTLVTQSHEILLNNVPHPAILTSTDGIGSPDIGSASATTVAIPPGMSVKLTVRVVDPLHKNRIIPATSFLTPVIVAQAVNTADLNNPNNPNPQPPISMVITTPSLADGVTTVQYKPVQMTALFGVGTLTWSVTPPIEGPLPLPPGLTLSSSGVLSGTPTLAGTYAFQINVQDSATPKPHHASRNYTMHIADPLQITTKTLSAGISGLGYSASLSAIGGLAPLSWSITSGALPAGLTLGSDGTISGTPTAAGAFSFTAQALDSSTPTQSAASTLRLDIASTLFYYLRQDAKGTSTFGNISTAGAINDQFVTGTNFDALAFAQPDIGYGSGLFYYVRHDASGFNTFGTISTGGAVVDRFGIGYGFDSITFSPDDVGYGPNLFYYVRHDGNGFSTFGTISTSGAILDRFGVGNNFNALAYAPNDVGYGKNLFYYLRTDPQTGFSTFGTISTSGAIVDRFGVGSHFDGLNFWPADVGYGPNLFYYFRHDANLFSTFGTISTSGAILDRFGVGNGFNAIAAAALLDYGPVITTQALPDAYPQDSESGPYTFTLTSTGGVAPIQWSINSGSLPAGLGLDGATISGSPTEVTFKTIRVRATDALGMTADRSLTIQSWAPRSAYCASSGTFPLFNNTNIAGVQTGATSPIVAASGRPNGYTLKSIATYHSFAAYLVQPKLGLVDANQQPVGTGPWGVALVPASAGFQNWQVDQVPGSPVLNGTYTVSDGDSSTWAFNTQSSNTGFTQVCVTPNP